MNRRRIFNCGKKVYVVEELFYGEKTTKEVRAVFKNRKEKRKNIVLVILTVVLENMTIAIIKLIHRSIE